MKNKVLLVLVLLAGLSANATGAGVEWKQKMQELASALADAIPYLYPAPEQDPKGLSEKLANIHEITRKLEDGMKHSSQIPDSDPALPYIASLLNSSLEQARQGLNDGHADYAKSALRASVGYCIACHTRTQEGTEFPILKAFTEPLKRASWIERIEFMTASRQFDSVLAEVTKELERKGEPTVNQLDLERASRIALSIAVRAKKDPAKAESVAKSVARSKGASHFMKEGAKVWLKDIASWKAVAKKKLKSDKEIIEAARLLIQHAREPGLPGGHSEVDYLRASVLVHDLIKTFPSSEYIAEALYIVGLSYDSLRELGLWSMHEMYFQACVSKAPHTELAEKCAKSYEASVVLGYSGSSGVHVPAPVRRHIESVKRQAKRLE